MSITTDIDKLIELNIDWRTSRQASMVSPIISDFSVCIVGAGGIGSNLAHTLISMGIIDITLVDADEVGEENIYPGFFFNSDREIAKVFALQSTLEEMYGVSIKAVNNKIENTNLNEEEFDIVIVCTDSLPSRALAWQALGEGARYWIDARMGGPGFDVYALDTQNDELVDRYLETFNRTPGHLPCGMKATAFITKGYINGVVGEIVRDIANAQPFAFHYRYDADDKIWVIEPPVAGMTWLQYLLSLRKEGGDSDNNSPE